ncbi:putative disease resistance protein RGA4 [Tasmannia lanceolata]|uniref:putative disease resistance protein RGA4 n=1 Tax=Tasmannia lanceolata TaxID=3420 RepID=UPI00406486F2
MADAILGILLKNLHSLIQNEFQFLGGVKKDMENLLRIVKRIRLILPNGEAMAVKNEELKYWLTELSDAAYDADDILADWAVEDQRVEVASTSGCGNIQVSNTFLPCFHFRRNTFRHKIGTRVKEILGRLNSIAEERQKFNLEVTTLSSENEERTPTMSLVNESEVYGRDVDKEKIVKLLLADVSNENDVPVIAIVGMGGLGKTTLAQLVYNDQSVKSHFELRMWIYVSQDFVVTRIVKAILDSATGSSTDLTQLDEMQKRLQDRICEKRFLLVLDDVWSEDREKWGTLKKILTCKGKGSKIVATTRKETVASVMCALPESLHLTGLSNSDCWSLFESQAFEVGRSKEHPNLVEIGKEIVKKCGGVPLAAKALGSLLRLKREEASWLSVRDGQIWELPEDENLPILPTIRLSYTNLPSPLRQCFSFCCVFPKGFTIVKEELILMWIVNDFVTPNTRMELEDTGNEIFNDLLQSSFFQDIEKDYDGNITTCKMNDLVHDLAQSIIGNMCYVVDLKKRDNIPPLTRYVFSDDQYSLLECPSLYKAKAIRTMLLGRVYGIQIPSDIKELRYLRCLNLSGVNIKEIPHSICNLKQLRYLNLSNNDSIETLPESISCLQNLQTLKLRECSVLSNLPRDMRKMSRLRHVDTCGCISLTCIPIGIGQLSSLQTLSNFIVGEEEGRRPIELHNLNLRGELSIKQLSLVRSAKDAEQANLKSKKNLRKLELSWKDDPGDVEMQVKVLEGLEPHCYLKDLLIQGYAGIRFPGWMQTSSLANLVKVSLIDCQRCENLPPLGQLPSLKILEIDRMRALKQINNEFYGNSKSNGFSFPSLKKLWLNGMDNLEMWASVEEGGAFPCLNEFEIEYCRKLITLPCFLHLTSLRIKYLDEMSSFPERFLRHGNVLQHLYIHRCKKLRSLPRELDNFIALKTLSINACDELVSLPEGLRNLTSLEKLEIIGCDSLISLPEERVLHALISLQTLLISSCPITSLPNDLQYLTALKRLEIEYCDELASLPKEGVLQGLISLQSLVIVGCHKLVSLSDDFQHLTALQNLNIGYCDGLASLPNGLQHVTTLQILIIEKCLIMENLPEWIEKLTSLRYLSIRNCGNMTSLPAGLQRLAALKQLYIEDCPHLARRCKRERGEDWHKIAHVPFITIE